MTNSKVIFLGAFIWTLGLLIVASQNWLIAAGLLLCIVGAAFYTSGEDEEDEL